MGIMKKLFIALLLLLSSCGKQETELIPETYRLCQTQELKDDMQVCVENIQKIFHDDNNLNQVQLWEIEGLSVQMCLISNCPYVTRNCVRLDDGGTLCDEPVSKEFLDAHKR